MTVKAVAPMAKLKMVTPGVVHRRTCQKVLEWEFKTASRDRKGKYKVASKSTVPECLEHKSG